MADEKIDDKKIEEKEEKVIFQQQYVEKKVDNIIFSVASPQLIKKMACAKIVTPELYDKEGYPVDGG